MSNRTNQRRLCHAETKFRIARRQDLAAFAMRAARFQPAPLTFP
jgi:uncharacterized membrane protein